MLIIKQPKIINTDENHSRLSCDIYVNDELRNVWFEVEKEYEQYLCTERSDAFVIGLLSWAMRLNHDIKCEVPVTEEIMYGIKTYLMQLLPKYGKTLHAINIIADTAPALPNAGGVGTGCSCGVDSFHAILSNIDSEYKDTSLTHICLFDTGVFGDHDSPLHKDGTVEQRGKDTREVADALNLKAVITDSNFADVFKQDFLVTHTYVQLFAVFCMQKLWKTYFYASGYDISKFTLKNNDLIGASSIDLLLFYCLSTRNLKIYSEGGAITRFDKVKRIADNQIVQNHLIVCPESTYNCSRCPKCIRTMITLDILGKLDEFSNVFDVNYYRKHIHEYYINLCLMHLKKDKLSEIEYNILKNKISLADKFIAISWGLFRLIRKHYRILTKNKAFNYSIKDRFK